MGDPSSFRQSVRERTMQNPTLLVLLVCIIGVCTAQGPGDINLGPSDHVCSGLSGAESDPDACNQYFICYTHPTTKWQCRGNLLFDEYYMGCNYPEYTSCGNRPKPTSSVTPTTTASPTTPLTPFKCPSPSGTFPVSPSQKCSQTYYLCVEDVPYQQACPGNTVFNINTCMSADAAGCSVPTTTPSQSFTCPSPDGFYPYPDTCTKFYQCIGGKPFIYSCPSSLYFNPAIRACDWPANVPSCTKLDFFQNVISNEIETIESQKFICPKPDGHYVDPTNCNHYFICIDGVPVSNICPEGLYYDEVNNLCNYPELVNCDATPTTQATK